MTILEKAKTEDVTQWAKTHEKLKPNMVFIYDGRIVAAGGLGILWPGVAEAWLHLERNCPGRAIVEVKRQLYEWIEEHHLWRVAALVNSEWKQGNRFLEWLGMSFEGRLRKIAPDGTDENLWAVVR
jgi:hypothetical protein